MQRLLSHAFCTTFWIRCHALPQVPPNSRAYTCVMGYSDYCCFSHTSWVSATPWRILLTAAFQKGGKNPQSEQNWFSQELARYQPLDCHNVNLRCPGHINYVLAFVWFEDQNFLLCSTLIVSLKLWADSSHSNFCFLQKTQRKLDDLQLVCDLQLQIPNLTKRGKMKCFIQTYSVISYNSSCCMSAEWQQDS